MVLLSSAQIADAIVKISKTTYAAAILVVAYVYVSIEFSFFPWTRGYAVVLLDYVLAPLRSTAASLAAHLPNFFFVVVIIFLGALRDEAGETDFQGDWAGGYNH